MCENDYRAEFMYLQYNIETFINGISNLFWIFYFSLCFKLCLQTKKYVKKTYMKQWWLQSMLIKCMLVSPFGQFLFQLLFLFWVPVVSSLRSISVSVLHCNRALTEGYISWNMWILFSSCMLKWIILFLCIHLLHNWAVMVKHNCL